MLFSHFSSLNNRFKKYKVSDTVFLCILALAPTFGSLSTILLCGMGFYFFFKCISNRNPYVPQYIFVIGNLYLIYFIYFFFNGFFQNGLLVTIKSMAPNLPILLYFFVAKSKDWQNSYINPNIISNVSICSVWLAVGVAVFLYLEPINHQFFGKNLMEHADIYKRVRLFSGNALVFSSMLVAVSFFSLLDYHQRSPAKRFLAWSTILATGCLIVFFSQSRGAQLTFLVLLATSFMVLRTSFNFHKNLQKRTVFPCTIVVIFCVFIISHFSNGNLYSLTKAGFDRTYLGVAEFFSTNMDSQQISDGSVTIRKEIYKGAIYAFKENPLVGHGSSAISDIVKEKNKRLEKYEFTHLHNSFLNHLVSGGLIGFFLFLAIISLPIYILFSTKDFSKNSVLFCALIFANSLSAGITNLYLNHDLLTSFHSTLPFLYALVVSNSKFKV